MGPGTPARAPRLLIVSNGHGEDVIGAALARELRVRRPDLEVEALPLVGTGRRYLREAVALAGPVRELPSGGLTLHDARLLRADLRAGLLGLTARQLRALAGARWEIVLVVGDLYAQALAALSRARARYVFQPLVSAWTWRGPGGPPQRYFMERIAYPERALMRHLARRVYARDEPTARKLRALGVRCARCLGNPIVDAAQGRPVPGLRRPGRPLVAILPGSRDHAAASFRLWWETLERLPEVDAVVAWTREAPPVGPAWRRLRDGARWEALRGAQRFTLLGERFGDVLASADAAAGHAGTAHEQAAASGLPVLTGPLGRGFGREFVLNQARLLGDALTVVEGDAAARAAALRELLDPQRRRRAARAGRERIGTPGASARIAADLLADAEAAGALTARSPAAHPLPLHSE